MILSELIRKYFNLPEKECSGCALLVSQLATEKYEKKELLDRLLDITKPRLEEAVVNEIQPIPPKFIPIAARRAEKEKQDRIQARALKEVEESNKSDLELLEKAVGIDNG